MQDSKPRRLFRNLTPETLQFPMRHGHCLIAGWEQRVCVIAINCSNGLRGKTSYTLPLCETALTYSTLSPRWERGRREFSGCADTQKAHGLSSGGDSELRKRYS